MLDWMESELSSDFLDYPEIFYTIHTFSGLSRQFLDTDRVWILGTVSKLAVKFIDCVDSFWILQTLFRLSGKSLYCPDSS